MTAVQPERCCARVERLAGIAGAAVPRPVDTDEVARLLEAAGQADRALWTVADRVLRRLGRPHPVRAPGWDWRGLAGRRLIVARLVAAVGFGVVAVLWGPAAVLPALGAVPLGELLVAWHGGQVRAGVWRYGDRRVVLRHLGAVGRRALLAVVPPVVAGTALLAAAGHLASVTPLRAAVGVLLAGWYPLLLLLASARRLLVGLGIVAVLLPVAGAWALVYGYLLALVVAAAGLSTGSFGRPPRLPRVLTRALRRPARLEDRPCGAR